MFVSRRKFLRTGVVVSAAVMLKPATLVFGNNTAGNAPTKKAGVQFYSREMFEPYVGDTFRVRVGKQMVDLKLVALTNEKSARTDCFSMRFQAPKSLPATVHTLNHSKLGKFDLFIVQSTAIVNHVV